MPTMFIEYTTEAERLQCERMIAREQVLEPKLQQVIDDLLARQPQ